MVNDKCDRLHMINDCILKYLFNRIRLYVQVQHVEEPVVLVSAKSFLPHEFIKVGWQLVLCASQGRI